MRRTLIVALILLSLASTAHAQRFVCLSSDGVFRPPAGCIEQQPSAAVRPVDRDRKFAFYDKQSYAVKLGILPAGESALDMWPQPMIAFNYWLGGDSEGIAVLTEEKLGTWKVALDAFWFSEGRLNIQVPPGKWRYSVTRDGKVLTESTTTFVRREPSGAERGVLPGRIHLSGRAVASDGKTAADFAEITADCNRVVCIADANGAFRCHTPVPRGGAFCVEHPSLGRKRIELEGRTGSADFGVVQLVSGSTLRVVKPLHVELPEKTTISLRRRDQEIGEPQVAGAREVIEFDGLAPGPYTVLLAGPGPLERKLFPVEVREGAPAELILSLDPYRLTGEVELRKKPLEAKVMLEGEAWSAALETDQSGRFDAELWAPGDYGVAVQAPSLEQPYLVMKRASPSDSHWRLVVPSRRITGRVFDAESGKPIRDVAVQVEADDGSTRANRVVNVREDGTFEYPGAADGHYSFTAMAPGYLGGEKVQLTIREADGDQRLDLPLLRGVTVRVTVLDPAGNPLSGATVLSDFAQNGMPMRTSRTNAEGAVDVMVAEKGEKTIYVVPPHASFAAARVTARHAENGLRIIVPEGLATLRVQTKSSEDQPLPGISIALRHRGEPVPQGVLATMARDRKIALATNAAGELTIPALPAGDYEIAWRTRGTAPVPGWTKVTLGAGETKVTQTFAAGGK